MNSSSRIRDSPDRRPVGSSDNLETTQVNKANTPPFAWFDPPFRRASRSDVRSPECTPDWLYARLKVSFLNILNILTFPADFLGVSLLGRLRL